ncbi:hypothetical protein QUF74_17610 [Candidatus Halobeggiatoa sp. HSG11]|nr:hypothetical protein [Candidatus Halobeggiatoa sp. HSG11]
MSELSIIKIIIIGLQYLNLYYVADVFLIISIALFLTAIYKHVQIASTLLASLGIFTTIFIISIGISHFDSNAIEKSIPELLNGLAIAFIFEFINLVLILILRFVNKRRVKKSDNNGITPTAIYLTLREISTYNNATQKPLLNNILEQLRLSQENTQKILQLKEVNTSKKLGLLMDIKSSLVDEDSLIKQVKIEISNGFNKLFNELDNKVEKSDIEKIRKGLQNVVDQINSISDNELVQSLQIIKPYLESLEQQFQVKQNLTQGTGQILQNNSEKLLENSVENEGANKFKYIYNQAFNFMDSGKYQNAITYFSQAIKLNSQDFSLYYNQSCCHALLGEIEPALDNLNNAILLNKQCIEMAKTDLDFDKIRNNPKFQILLVGS